MIELLIPPMLIISIQILTIYIRILHKHYSGVTGEIAGTQINLDFMVTITNGQARARPVTGYYQLYLLTRGQLRILGSMTRLDKESWRMWFDECKFVFKAITRGI